MQPSVYGSNGFVTLTAVIIIGALLVIMSVGLLQSGVAGARVGIAREAGLRARLAADACAERALQEIRNDTSFTGSATLTVGGVDCSYTVTSQGGQNRTIQASATAGAATRRVMIRISEINPLIVVDQWEEVAQF